MADTKTRFPLSPQPWPHLQRATARSVPLFHASSPHPHRREGYNTMALFECYLIEQKEVMKHEEYFSGQVTSLWCCDMCPESGTTRGLSLLIQAFWFVVLRTRISEPPTSFPLQMATMAQEQVKPGRIVSLISHILRLQCLKGSQA